MEENYIFQAFVTCSIGMSAIGFVVISYAITAAIISFTSGHMIRLIGRPPVFAFGNYLHFITTGDFPGLNYNYTHLQLIPCFCHSFCLPYWMQHRFDDVEARNGWHVGLLRFCCSLGHWRCHHADSDKW